MSVLKNFKNTPGRPMGGRQALSVIFFFKFATRSLAKKNTLGFCRPWLGRQDPCRPHRATGGIFEIFQNGHIFLKF